MSGSGRRDPWRWHPQPVAVVRRVAPEIAWPYLRRVAEVVLPEAAGSPREPSGDVLGAALNDMLSTERT